MVLNKFLGKSDQRMAFVEFWADYVKKTPNKIWSKQQADFINAVLKGANMDKELYLKVKESVKDSVGLIKKRKLKVLKLMGTAKGAKSFERDRTDRIERW